MSTSKKSGFEWRTTDQLHGVTVEGIFLTNMSGQMMRRRDVDKQTCANNAESRHNATLSVLTNAHIYAPVRVVTTRGIPPPHPPQHVHNQRFVDLTELSCQARERHEMTRRRTMSVNWASLPPAVDGV